MAERENPFTVMKRYLATMNKRIDELGSKTNSLEEEVKRIAVQSTSESSRISDKHESDRAQLSNRLDELSSKAEEHQVQLMQSVGHLKEQIEEFRSTIASREDLQAMQSSLRDEISPLREQKLERSEFQEFVEKNNASMKDVFEDLSGSQSFADFATTHVTARHEPEPEPEPEPAPLVEEVPAESESPAPIERESPPSGGFIPERRRDEKKKKKWL